MIHSQIGSNQKSSTCPAFQNPEIPDGLTDEEEKFGNNILKMLEKKSEKLYRKSKFFDRLLDFLQH